MATPAQGALLVQGGTVVTMNPRGTVIDDGAVAICDGMIAAVGRAADLQREYAGSRVIDASGGLITPGLIDAHNHPIHYLSKGLADDLELSQRSYERIWPYEAALTDEEAYVSSLGTFAEM